jgi:hypothetical protein
MIRIKELLDFLEYYRQDTGVELDPDNTYIAFSGDSESDLGDVNLKFPNEIAVISSEDGSGSLISLREIQMTEEQKIQMEILDMTGEGRIMRLEDEDLNS